MQIRCPHCQNGIELVDDSDLQSVDCPSCGSQFGLVDVDQKNIGTLHHAGNTTIGHFELLNEVGRGAFGSVWQAHDSKLDRKVAVKVPRSGQFTQSSREQFLREARAAAQLNHPNIVSVYEVGLDDDRIYIVSDFVDGISLADLLSADRLSPRQAIGLCLKVVLALEHAHQNGVIHRDLKPANIMLGENNEPFVMDFGLAKRDAGEITMTFDGKLLGTPAYMPPEQARGEGHHVDRRADVYSVGVILYELLTGELPFRGTMRMLLHQVIHEEAPSPRKLNNSIPRDLETITLKCLEKEPGKRYETCAAFAEDLQAWLDHKPIKARPTSWLERSWRWCKRKPAVAALSAGMLLVLLGASVISTVFAVTANRKAREADVQRRRADSRADEARKALEYADEQRIVATEKSAEAVHNLLLSEKNHYGADMVLIQRDWNENRISQLKERLEKYGDRDDLTGFEWGYWNRLINNDLFSIKGLYGLSSFFALAPDGKWIALCGERAVSVSDGETGKKIWTQKHLHTGLVTDVILSFSPDGKRIASVLSSASSDSRDRNNVLSIFEIRDTETGQLIRAFKREIGTSAIAFSPDGTRIAHTDNKTVSVLDGETGHEIRTLELPETGAPPEIWKLTATCLSFSPDGEQIVVSYPTRIVVWNLGGDGEAQSAESVADEDTVGDVIGATAITNRVRTLIKNIIPDKVGFSPDGKWIVATVRDEPHGFGGGPTRQTMLKTWNAETYKETTLKIPAGDADSHILTTFNLERMDSEGYGIIVVSASDSGTLKVYETAYKRCHELLTFKGQIGPIRNIELSRDGRRLASKNLDSLFGEVEIKIWDLGLDFDSNIGANCFSFSPDGKRIVVAPASTDSFFGAVDVPQIYDAYSGQKVLICKESVGGVYSVVFSPDGKRIVAGGDNATVGVWDAETGQRKLTLVGDFQNVINVAFSGDGNRILSVATGKDENIGFRLVAGEIKVWNAVTGEEVLTLRDRNVFAGSVAFSPDGTRIARIVNELTEFAQSQSLANMSRNEKDDHPVRIQVNDAETGQLELTLRDVSSPIISVTFSPDGNRILTSTIFSITAWDAINGEKLFTIERPGDNSIFGTNAVIFSPDGKWFTSVGYAEGQHEGLDVQPGSIFEIRDAETGQLKLTFRGDFETSAMAFSPDGKRILTSEAGLGRRLVFWDVETGQQVLTLTTNSVGARRANDGREFMTVEFSPDGTQVYSGGFLGTTQRPLGTLEIWDARPIKDNVDGGLRDAKPSVLNPFGGLGGFQNIEPTRILKRDNQIPGR